jgi:hypothetical protein
MRYDGETRRDKKRREVKDFPSKAVSKIVTTE